MSNHSIIEHRANYHYVRIEEDFIAICMKGKANIHCKALILSILEQWANTKRSKGEEPIIYMSYPQWIKATYWLFGRNVIIEALEELEAEKFIERRPYRMYGKDTFSYTLNVKLVQERIRLLPEKAQDETLPNFDLKAFKIKRVPNQTRPISNGDAVYNQTGKAFNKGRNISSITQLPDITSEESTDADASHAHALQEEVTHRLEHPVMQAISEEMVEQAEEELHATTPSRTDTRVSVGAGHRASRPSVDRHAAQAEVAGSQGSQTSRATPRAVRPGDAAREEGISDESHPTRDVSDGALVDATPVRRGVEAVASPSAQSVDTSRPASRTTGAAGSAPPQSSGPRRSGRKAQAQDVTQALSLQGAQVKEWMESIKGRKRRMTPKNVEAWNALAEEEDISFENLRDVIAEWEKSQFAKEHPDYVFDEHVLTRDGGGFTFSKGMDIVRRKRRGKDPVAAGQTVSGYQYYQKPKSAKVEVD